MIHTHTRYMYLSICRYQYKSQTLTAPFLWLIQAEMELRKKCTSLRVWEFLFSMRVISFIAELTLRWTLKTEMRNGKVREKIENISSRSNSTSIKT